MEIHGYIVMVFVDGGAENDLRVQTPTSWYELVSLQPFAGIGVAAVTILLASDF
jgi:hypothetical protein